MVIQSGKLRNLLCLSLGYYTYLYDKRNCMHCLYTRFEGSN